MEIRQMLLTPSKYTRPQTKIKPTAIAWHWVGNPNTSALANRNYFESLKDTHKTKASSHYIIGLEGEILQLIPEKELNNMNEYINLTLENIDKEHICCAIGDKKHQAGVESKKEWIKSKLSDGHIFRKLDTRGKVFIEYEPIETAWVPISGKNYEYIYCLWVAGSFKGNGIAKDLLEYAINDSKEKGMSGICTLTSKKKKQKMYLVYLIIGLISMKGSLYQILY